MIKQVVNETDWFNAMYDYMAEQLDGRFRLQFPNQEEPIDDLLEDLSDPWIRASQNTMLYAIQQIVAAHGSRLTLHQLIGCEEEENHEFQKELLHLVWDARNETVRWLHRQGVIPGQSVN